MVIENNTDKVLDIISHFPPNKREKILKVLSSHEGNVSQITTYDRCFMIIFKFAGDSRGEDYGLSYIISKEKQELIDFIRREYHNFLGNNLKEKERLITELINYSLTIVK